MASLDHNELSFSVGYREWRFEWRFEQEAITWAMFFCCDMASLDHFELNNFVSILQSVCIDMQTVEGQDILKKVRHV